MLQASNISSLFHRVRVRSCLARRHIEVKLAQDDGNQEDDKLRTTFTMLERTGDVAVHTRHTYITNIHYTFKQRHKVLIFRGAQLIRYHRWYEINKGNFVVGFRVAQATVMQEILLAARSWIEVPISMASNLLAFSSSSFSANQAFTASVQDSNLCRSAVNDEDSKGRKSWVSSAYW